MFRVTRLQWVNTQRPSDIYIDGLVQDYSISSALSMEILQSCTKLSTCVTELDDHYSGNDMLPIWHQPITRTNSKWSIVLISWAHLTSQIARFMGPTWGPPGSCRPQVGPTLAPWTLLSGTLIRYARTQREKGSTGNSQIFHNTWWHHSMQTLSALLALWVGSLPVTCRFPSQRASDVEIWCFLCLARTSCWTYSRVVGNLRCHGNQETSL